MTCITRPGSKSSLPSGVATKSVDYSDASSLTAALQDQHVLVEAFNPAATSNQGLILQAALAAGVERIITPDFSGDLFNPNINEVMIFEPKMRAKPELEKFIEASNGTMSWTAIITGPWYDWSIDRGIFWVNKEKRTITRFGSGNQKVSISRHALCGEALVAVLVDPEKFRNRPAYFASHSVSTNQIIDAMKEIGFGDWEIVDVPFDSFFDEARRLWEEDTVKGVENRLQTTAYPMLATVSFMDETNRYGADFGDKLEPGWDEGDAVLKENLRKLLI